jgi:hypothetical protein
MRPESAEEIRTVAVIAARIYGQEFESLPTHSRDRWLEAARHAVPGRGDTAIDKAAGQAVRDWAVGRVRREAEEHKRLAALKTLGLGVSATPEEIESAHKRLIRVHHPDAGGSVETAKQINAAYQLLKGNNNGN